MSQCTRLRLVIAIGLLFFRVIGTNLKAAVNVSQVICKKMIDAGNGGSIVNVTSIVSVPRIVAPNPMTRNTFQWNVLRLLHVVLFSKSVSMICMHCIFLGRQTVLGKLLGLLHL